MLLALQPEIRLFGSHLLATLSYHLIQNSVALLNFPALPLYQNFVQPVSLLPSIAKISHWSPNPPRISPPALQCSKEYEFDNVVLFFSRQVWDLVALPVHHDINSLSHNVTGPKARFVYISIQVLLLRFSSRVPQYFSRNTTEITFVFNSYSPEALASCQLCIRKMNPSDPSLNTLLSIHQHFHVLPSST